MLKENLLNQKVKYLLALGVNNLKRKVCKTAILNKIYVRSITQ